LRSGIYGRLTRIASAIVTHRGLTVVVEGNSDSPRGAREAAERAAAVHDALVVAGVPSAQVTARSLGDTRPVVSNATAAGRLQNRRVEITISGGPIGAMASWDRTYPLLPK
jgi:outer membrane protein OmpA-like peptidoglycan-associated protein